MISYLMDLASYDKQRSDEKMNTGEFAVDRALLSDGNRKGKEKASLLMMQMLTEIIISTTMMLLV